MFPTTRTPLTEFIPPQPRRKLEPKPQRVPNPCHLSREAFNRRLEEIAAMEDDKAARKALKELNRRLQPHVSRGQMTMWQEVCGIWFVRRESECQKSIRMSSG